MHHRRERFCAHQVTPILEQSTAADTQFTKCTRWRRRCGCEGMRAAVCGSDTLSSRRCGLLRHHVVISPVKHSVCGLRFAQTTTATATCTAGACASTLACASPSSSLPAAECQAGRQLANCPRLWQSKQMHQVQLPLGTVLLLYGDTKFWHGNKLPDRQCSIKLVKAQRLSSR